VPGINVLDARGLTHRPAAEATAANASEAWMRARIADPTTRPAFLRLANWESEQHPEYPEWLVGPYQLRADLKYGGGSIRWYADTNVRPSPERREHRWDTMLRRHPSQPFLWWHAALSAMADGSRSRALDIAGRARSRWPAMSVFRDSPASLSFIRGTRALEWTDRGFTLAPGETLTSAPVPGGRLEAAGGAVRVADPCSTTSEAEEMVLPSCEPRQLVVSNPQPDTVFVRLHPTAER
jgi:hypothetical protein